ncbi:VOC family protein [Dactylosporangium vinaceum]|uniref:VOC family protein n=1 Tax=Dactylosporangium vinaceum TaxID=53362 RepID=UPI0036D35B03
MAVPRQQFNVNLDPALVRRIKHHAVDVQLSLSDLVARVLQQHLDKESAMTEDQPALILQPMVHVEDMPASVAFYEALGATVEHGSRDGDFVMLRIGAGRVGLLAHPPNPEQHEGQVELNFETTEPLETVEARLRAAAAVTIAQPTTDEGFGRQLQVTTPDGLLIKINELDRELYT